MFHANFASSDYGRCMANEDMVVNSILLAKLYRTEEKFVVCSLTFEQQQIINKRHAMHAEAMTFHKGSLIIFRTFVKKLGYIKVTDNFCAE